MLYNYTIHFDSFRPIIRITSTSLCVVIATSPTLHFLSCCSSIGKTKSSPWCCDHNIITMDCFFYHIPAVRCGEWTVLTCYIPFSISVMNQRVTPVSIKHGGLSLPLPSSATAGKSIIVVARIILEWYLYLVLTPLCISNKQTPRARNRNFTWDLSILLYMTKRWLIIISNRPSIKTIQWI